jgi:hypothetical protein
MRFRHYALRLCLCFLAISISGFAQQRDPVALAWLQQAVNLMGGPAIAQVHSAVMQGNLQSSMASASGPFSWENAGSEFRYENPSQGDVSLFLSGHGQPTFTDSRGTLRLSSESAIADFPAHLVAVVLLDRLADTTCEVTSLGTVTVGGAAVVEVRTRYISNAAAAAVTELDWYFDPKSGLPVQVDHRIPVANQPDNLQQVSVGLSKFAMESGVLVPHQLRFYSGGDLRVTASITSVSFNGTINPGDFDPPQGAR